MAKHISTSQLKSKIRQAERKQKQAINDYNRAVRKYNSSLQKAVNSYNQLVRTYNQSVRRNRQIINREVGHLKNCSNNTYISTVYTMQQRYEAVGRAYPEGREVTSEQNGILDLIEQEQANSIIAANTVNGVGEPVEDTEDIEIGERLREVSEDLNDRWKGAVYSLSPQNPDAARHFCTSAREIFTEFIELKAPDRLVFEFNPSCEKTERGNATRREKIKYMMRSKHMDESVIEFAEADITNILELFHVLSDGTHGAAGRYEFSQLLCVKKRVEQGIIFLCAIA